MSLCPPRLPEGATIGIVGPAGPMVSSRLERGVKYLHSKGYRTKLGASIYEVRGYLAGGDRQRVADLNLMFADPEVDAIFCTRGGYGTPRLLDLVDYEQVLETPKILVGYSDITALHLALHTKTGLISFSGPMVAVEMGKGMLPFTEKAFWPLLISPDPQAELIANSCLAQNNVPSKVQGKLFPCNLSMLSTLIGTPFLPDLAGAILVLEDVGETLYKIDRHLTQLRHCGILSNLSGLVLGAFCGSEENPDSIQTLRTVVEEVTDGLNLPILFDLAYGHIDAKYTLPVGVNALMDLNRKCIEIIGSAVA